MKIGVIGGGVVGRATARAFVEHVDEVLVYDVVKERSTHFYAEVACNSDITFICLPTPQKKNSLACDVSIVEKFFENAERVRHNDFNWVLRSTVPIGTTKLLAKKYNLPNLVHSPEFLTARCAITDAQMPARNVIGSPTVAQNNPGDSCRDILWSLYSDRFPGVPVYQLSSDESEAVKLFQNAHSAVKVSLFNEFRTVADHFGMDWDRVLKALLAGGWIGSMHTQVPGPDGRRGFGGSCLPKDLSGLVHQMVELGLDPSVCNAARLRNSVDRERS